MELAMIWRMAIEESATSCPVTRANRHANGTYYMPSPEKKADSQTDLPARELLKLYDELTELHACSAFVMQALAAALVNGGGLDERSATGAVFCAQWLNDRTTELEQQLKHIVSQAYVSTTAAGS